MDCNPGEYVMLLSGGAPDEPEAAEGDELGWSRALSAIFCGKAAGEAEWWGGGEMAPLECDGLAGEWAGDWPPDDPDNAVFSSSNASSIWWWIETGAFLIRILEKLSYTFDEIMVETWWDKTPRTGFHLSSLCEYVRE